MVFQVEMNYTGISDINETLRCLLYRQQNLRSNKEFLFLVVKISNCYFLLSIHILFDVKCYSKHYGNSNIQHVRTLYVQVPLLIRRNSFPSLCSFIKTLFENLYNLSKEKENDNLCYDPSETTLSDMCSVRYIRCFASTNDIWILVWYRQKRDVFTRSDTRVKWHGHPSGAGAGINPRPMFTMVKYKKRLLLRCIHHQWFYIYMNL